jgi:hypothetical protein
MKINNYLYPKMIVGAVALALAAFASMASAEDVPQMVTVIRMHGEARYKVTNGGDQWHVIHVGDVLTAGSLIETSEKGTVDILLGDKSRVPTVSPVSVGAPSPTSSYNGGGGAGDSSPKANIIRIFPSTVLAIDKLILDRTGTEETAETQLDLRAGQILGNVKKLSAASRYEVKIPNGVAGVRGTVYVANANGNIYVFEGEVVVSYMGANGVVYSKTIAAGEVYTPSPSGGTVTPIPPGFERFILDIIKFFGVPPSGPETVRIRNIGLVFISPTGPGS